MGERKALGMIPVSVDVCVPVHNALPLVKRCLTSIHANTKEPYRMIVHDDASDPETAEWLEGTLRMQNAPVILIRSDKQCWFTTSVNRCLQMTTAPWVVVLNSDVEIQDPEWFEKLIAVHGSREMVGLLGCPDSIYADQPAYEVDGKIQGHLWFFRWKNMQTVGLLDEQNQDLIHIRSDDEWSARWRARGFKTLLVPNIRHVHGDESCPGGGASWGRQVGNMPSRLEHVREARELPPRLLIAR